MGGLGATNGVGFGGALAANRGTMTLASCLVANSVSDANNFGQLVDAGYNLSSDASCNFTNFGSLNSTDPKLVALADNGGPTPTCALLPDSPAIDAGNPASALAGDQRGKPRPVGFGPDMGAFEFGSEVLRIRAERTGSTLTLNFIAETNQPYRLLASDDLSRWIPVDTNLPTTTKAHFARPTSTNRVEFYRLVTP